MAAIGLAEYLVVGRDLAPFLAAYAATIGVVILFSFFAWKREQG